MKTNVLKASQPHKSKVENRKSESIRIASRRNKSGGVLIGLIIAMVVVGILSAAMVKMLQGQAVTSTKAYNVMRARYAAESGYSYLKTLSLPEQKALVGRTSSFDLLNGDVFTIEATTNTTHLLAVINGKMISGNSEVIATRPLKVQVSLGIGSGGVTPDTESPVVDDSGEGTTDTSGVSNPDNDAIIPLESIVGFIPKQGNGKNKVSDEWIASYNAILETHTPFEVTDGMPTSSAGITSGKLRTNLDIRYAEALTGKKDRMIWSVPLPLDLSDSIAKARAANSNYLAYDIQAKFSWEPTKRTDGNSGIAFTLKGTAENGYEFYALSFMRYSDFDESANLATKPEDIYIPGENSWEKEDCIPNQIKPKNEAKDDLIVVLWKQWVEADGTRNRTWLAYQNLSELKDALSQPENYLGHLGINRDSFGLMDATILLRVIEGTDSKGSFVDLQTYIADGFTRQENGNSSYKDRCTKTDLFRKSYPNYDAFSDSANYPYWPTLNLDDWNKNIDFFTATESNQETKFEDNKRTSANFLNDAVTIRIHDSAFNQSGGIGFVFCGNFLSGMKETELNNKDELKGDVEDADIPSPYMAVDDFAIRWLTTGGNSGGGTDIITDF